MFIPDLLFTSHCFSTVLWDLYQLYAEHEPGALVSVWLANNLDSSQFKALLCHLWDVDFITNWTSVGIYFGWHDVQKEIPEPNDEIDLLIENVNGYCAYSWYLDWFSTWPNVVGKWQSFTNHSYQKQGKEFYYQIWWSWWFCFCLAQVCSSWEDCHVLSQEIPQRYRHNCDPHQERILDSTAQKNGHENWQKLPVLFNLCASISQLEETICSLQMTDFL